MGEQSPPVQNKGMLVVAAVLGVAVVIVYNLQIAAVRSEAIGDQVKIVQFERDMRKGEKINPVQDVSVKEISRKLAEGLSDVAIVKNNDEMKALFQAGVLNRNVVKGNFFSTTMILTSESVDPALKIITPGNVLRAVPVRLQPGRVLRPGARVNLIAIIPGKDGRGHPERIIEDVHVHAVGGDIPRDSGGPGAGAGDEGMTTYRNITIEVPPQASLELLQVLSYVGSGVDVEVLNPNDPKSPRAGQVKAGLVQQLEGGTGAPPRGGGAGGGGGPL